MSEEKIQEYAKHCLNCKNKPCMKGCPINTDIPLFIDYIKKEEYEKAYEVVGKNNDLSHICALICPVEDQCEGACIRGIKGEPVKIHKLEQFLSEWIKENKDSVKQNNVENKQKRDIKVAVVGSGPAGLVCSAELARAGFSVTIFEEYKELGGILAYGIPEYRLSRSILKDTIDRILSLGIEAKINMSLGEDFTIETLKQEGYKYIFLGIGAKKSIYINIQNIQSKGVYGANDFLKTYNEGKKVDCKKVLVIGGGNVAIDSARSAVKMGAEEVTIVYRRRECDMPARDVEIEEAKEDNVKLIFQTNPVEVLVNNKNEVKGLKCVKTEMIDGKAKDISDTEFEIEADTVIMAIGSKPDLEMLNNLNIETNEKSFVVIDEYGKTNIDGVYAGGDVTSTRATVCKAVYCGKQAAKGIIFEVESSEDV